jgi:hypothetical protein
METKKIKLLMTPIDWELWQTITEFYDFIKPTLTWGRKKYQVEFDKVVFSPLKCGEDIGEMADLIVDRSSHWNKYSKSWTHSGVNSGVRMINNTLTNNNFDKHSTCDLLIRAMHPEDRHPTTVLLPEFHPYSPEQIAQQRWAYEQNLIIENTKYGYDLQRRTTDWEKINQSLSRLANFNSKTERARALFYDSGNYIKEAVDKYFGGKFPLYLKKVLGGGGSDVFKVKCLEELYEKYDQTSGPFHLQESIENYDIFIRCMGIGPQVLPMRYRPESPIHEHYSEEKITVDPKVWERLENYVLLINSFHRWTYNSFEALIKDGVIQPIDYANACPDSYFTSLHAHYPWLICALVKWMTFIVVTDFNMRPDTEIEEYFRVLRDPKMSKMEKYEFCNKKSREYFQVEKFEEFCEKNWKGLDEKMIEFYDNNIDRIITRAIQNSDFPKAEHEHFIYRYKQLMETNFRKHAKDYLSTVLYANA